MPIRQLVPVMVLLLAACGPAGVAPTPGSATAVATPVATATLAGTQPVESPGPLSDSPQASARFDVQTICPSISEDNLASLDLGREQRLIVRSDVSGDISSLVRGADGPLPIGGRLLELSPSAEYLDLAPGGSELLFLDHPADALTRTRLFSVSTNGTNRHDLLELSVDDDAITVELPDHGQTWRISDVDSAFLARWSGPKEITLWTRQVGARSLDPLYPVFHFNTFTLIGEALFASEAQAGWNLGWMLGPAYSVAGKAYDVYLGAAAPSMAGFFVFDRETGSRQPIFHWLKDESWMGWDYVTVSSFRYWQDADGLLTMVIVRPKGFDYASGLTTSAVEDGGEYADIMHSVELAARDIEPGSEAVPWASVRWVAPNQASFGLESNPTPGESQFYLVDLSKQSVRAYCRLGQTTVSTALTSSDGQYLSWTVRNREDQQGHDTMVMNLVTGRYVRLAGFSVLGWGD